ncbi:hypothetical protein KBA01_29170 [Kozakia baliensis]|nr:hypothetical protein KBA01_29170 [Kozakia baliensis]
MPSGHLRAFDRSCRLETRKRARKWFRFPLPEEERDGAGDFQSGEVECESEKPISSLTIFPD